MICGPLIWVLVVLHRDDHFKSRDTDIEHQFAVKIFHLVSTIHPAHFCAKIAAAHILVILPGLQRRLNANHTFAFHFTVAAVAVEDMPVPAVQFNGKSIVILQRNAVSKHEFRLQRVAVIRLVKGFHTYFHALGDHAGHKVKINKMYQTQTYRVFNAEITRRDVILRHKTKNILI